MKIQKDKLYHFLAAVIITWIMLLASHIWFPLSANLDGGLGFAIAMFFVTAKEFIWDKWWKMGKFEMMDFFWGFVGAVVGPIIWLVVEMILGTAEPFPW